MPAPALAEVRRRQQTIHGPGERIGGGVAEDDIDFVWRRRQAGQVERDAADERALVGRLRLPRLRFGLVGTEKRVDYTVLGTSVNIASRLESGVAKPGQVVISQNTLERVVGSFNTEPLGEFALKGLQQKLPVFVVLGGVDRDATTSPKTLSATRA